MMSNKLVTSLYHTLGAHSSDVNCVAFSNGDLLATASADKTARLWNTDDFSEHKHSPLCGHQYYVHCCTFSPFGTTLATCSTDGKLILWDVKTGKKSGVLHHESQNSIRVCRFSPNSKYILTGSDDELLCMWEVSSKKIIRTFAGHEASVVGCDFSPDSNFIVSGSCNGDLQVWDAKFGHGKCLKYIDEGHDLGVSCCQFSPTYGSAKSVSSDNGTVTFIFASGGQDDLIKIWNFQAVLGSAAVSVELRLTLKGHSGPVTCCSYSHDGSLLASGSIDKTVRLWDAIHGNSLHVIEGHVRYVTSCSFSYDGLYLASGSNDRTAVIWKITNEDELFKNIERNQSQCDTEEVKPVNKWSVEEVCKWLEEIGLEQYKSSFEQNAIDGTEIEVITDSMLQQIGIEAMGHRNKILRARKILQQGGSVKLVKDANLLDVGVPDEFLCPITREVMKDPVIAEDGYTYERSAIAGWMEKGKTTSPMTNGTLNTKQLTPNRSLKMLIQRYLQGQ